MKNKEPNEKDYADKIYYEDKHIKITEDFVTVTNKVVLPVDKITLVEIDHYSFIFYFSIIVTICTATLLLFFPSNPHYFVFAFCLASIWVRYEYDHYVALYVKLDDGTKMRILLCSLSKRNILYKAAESIMQSISDNKVKTDTQRLSMTETIKLKKFLECLDEGKIERTPEKMSYAPITTKREKK